MIFARSAAITLVGIQWESNGNLVGMKMGMGRECGLERWEWEGNGLIKMEMNTYPCNNNNDHNNNNDNEDISIDINANLSNEEIMKHAGGGLDSTALALVY